MNAAILLMASAVTAGQPAPPPAAAPAPAAHPAPAPAGCGDCGPVDCGCDVSCKRAGLLDKIKSRLHSRKAKCGCDVPPACDNCTPPAPPPPPPPPPPSCCEPPPCHDCHAPRVSILDRLRAKFKKKSHCDDCAPPPCDGCGAAPAPAPVPHPAPSGGGAGSAPTPTPAPMPPRTTTPPKAEVIVPGVVTPVSGPRLTGTTNPY